MSTERVQVLLQTEQRRRLEHESQRTGKSVSALIRDAVDQFFPTVTSEQRRAAFDELLNHGPVEYIPPDELDEIFESMLDVDIDLPSK